MDKGGKMLAQPWRGHGSIEYGGNSSSNGPDDFRVLERVERGRYRLLIDI